MIDVIKPLRLNPHADSVARELLAAFPEVTFTSGRRDRDQQARAMAYNVVLRRNWIALTYKPSSVRYELQRWIDEHPLAVTLGQIANGLVAAMKVFTDDELLVLSKHLSGDAFDFRPVPGPDGERIAAWLQARPDILYLSKEGGLDRSHVQTIPGMEPS